MGKGAHIIDSYLFDNVTVWEGARIANSILCEGVTVMPNACVKEGTVVSFKVPLDDDDACDLALNACGAADYNYN